MKIRTSVVRVLIASAALVAAVARAQEPADGRVQGALDGTDARIELAQSLVEDAENAQAVLEMNGAVALQGQAKQAFQQGQAAADESRARLFQQAFDLTGRARARADRAISLIQGLPDPERVLSQVERTRELLDRARERIEDCDRDRARALVRVALEMQTRAETATRDSRYLAGLQLTMSARERGLRALRLCNMQENLQEAAERALRRTDEILARARGAVGGRREFRTRNLMLRAERIESEAREHFQAGRYEASLRSTQSARTLAYRAIRVSGGGL